MTDDTSPEAVQAELEKLKVRRRAEYDNDLRELMGTRSGRRFMARVLEDTTGLRAMSFAADSTHLTAFNEGKRAVGIFLANECRRATPDEYVLMHEEQLEAARTYDLEKKLAESKAPAREA